MADLFLLSQAQMRRIERYFPALARRRAGGRPADRQRHRLCDQERAALARRAGRLWPAQDDLQSVRPLEPPGRVQQDIRRTGAQGRQAGTDHDRRHASEGAPHRCEPFKKGPVPRRIGRTKGGLNSKLHAVCDGRGRPLVMLLSEGQMSDYKGAALMLPALPNKARELLADKGYDADWLRAALARRGIAACIPSKSNRKVAIPYDAVLYKQRHRIENTFGRLKDWRRIHTRYDRCAHTYFSAICIAAAVIFWL